MTKEFLFSDTHEHMVKVYDGEKLLGSGCLKFGNGDFVQVDFFDPITITSDVEHLKARSDNGEKFTLLKCELEHQTLYASVVVGGDIDINIRKIVVRYADISTWFLYDYRLKGDLGHRLEWNEPPLDVDVTINSGGENFALKSYIFSTLKTHGEDQILHQHVNFGFSRPSGFFSLSDIEFKPHELACLLSIIIARPVSITSMWVDSDKGHLIPAYFPTFKRQERANKISSSWREALVSRCMLDGYWNQIVESYFSSPDRSLWIRFAGMQRYDGFWEYRVLGYVSLLDAYASNLTGSRNIKRVNTRTAQIDAMLGAIQNIKTPLTESQSKEIEKIIRSNIPKRRAELSFKDKYEYTISDTHADVVKIINLTESEFKIIKEARDAIAHGDSLKLKDVSYKSIHSTIQKITLLLTYRALTDFGITSTDFVQSLSRTCNSLRYTEGLDAVHLKRLTNPDSFIPVQSELFELVANSPGSRINACFTKDKDGKLAYSESYVSLYHRWVSTTRTSGASLYEVFEVEESRVKFMSVVHLECGDKTQELFSVYFIESSDFKT